MPADTSENPPLSPSAFLELVAARVERLQEAAPALLRRFAATLLKRHPG